MELPTYILDIVVDHARVTVSSGYSLRIIKNQEFTTKRELIGEIGFHHQGTESTLGGKEEMFIYLEAEELKIIGAHLVRVADYLLENKA